MGKNAAALVAFDEQRDDVVHVAYPELMADPVGATLAACSATGHGDASGGHAGAVAAYLAAQRDRRAAPPAGYLHLGYTADEIRRDSQVARYCERFGVDPETTRLVSPRPT